MQPRHDLSHFDSYFSNIQSSYQHVILQHRLSALQPIKWWITKPVIKLLKNTFSQPMCCLQYLLYNHVWNGCFWTWGTRVKHAFRSEVKKKTALCENDFQLSCYRPWGKRDIASKQGQEELSSGHTLSLSKLFGMLFICWHCFYWA